MGARVQQWVAQGEEQNGLFLALKQSNVATFGSTSRRYNEEGGQRRNVPENGTKQRRDVGCQRRDVPETYKIHVVMLISHVTTFQRGSKFNVATLITHIATFQRV